MITGRVHYPDGSPAAGVSLSLVSAGHLDRLLDTSPYSGQTVRAHALLQTTADGTFAVGVAEGEYDLVFDRWWDYLPQSIEGIRAAPDLEPITVTLQRSYVLEGRVHDSSGTPVDRVSVDVFGVDAIKREAVVGSDGRFLMGQLGAGRYEVYAEEQQSGNKLIRNVVVPGPGIELVLPHLKYRNEGERENE